MGSDAASGIADRRLSKRQEDVLVFIATHHAQKMLAPTTREIGEHFGWSSTNSVVEHLTSLARKGCIRWEPHRARTLCLTSRGHALVGRLAPVQLPGGEPDLAALRVQLAEVARERDTLRAALRRALSLCLDVYSDAVRAAGGDDPRLVGKKLARAIREGVPALQDEKAQVPRG